jgi:dipeptidase
MKKINVTVPLLAVLVLAVITAGVSISRSGSPADLGAAGVDLRPEGCTSILVGKDASTDGSTMTTHTCDCGTCDWTWRHVPAADHKPGSTRKIYHISQYKTWPPSEGLKWDLVKNDLTDLEIPEVAHTYAYHHGMFGYMNENQVSIGESTVGCQRKLRNPTPAAKLDLTMLTLLAMERAATAREAIQVIGSLAEKYGYGFHDGGEMLAIADPQEVWMFEIMPVGPLWTPESGKAGAVWCAQRVPDDHVSVCPNESRIGEIDLENPKDFLASSNVVSLAVEMGFYDPQGGRPFNWKRAYSPQDQSAASSNGRYQRMWRFFDIAAPSQKFKPETPNMDFPFSVKPDKKLSVKDVMEMTRDRSYGTPYDPVMGIRGGPFKNPNYYRQTRVIDHGLAEYTTVTQARAGLPDPIGGIVWISFGSQDTSCYMPFYAGVTDLPKSFTFGDHWTFDRNVARWAFDYTDFHVQVAYSEAIQDVQAAQAVHEDGAIARISEIDGEALALHRKKPAEAAKHLTAFCLNNAETVVKAWWKLGDDLLVKYNRLYLYDAENRRFQRGRPAIPDWWKKAVQAIDILMPQETK